MYIRNKSSFINILRISDKMRRTSSHTFACPRAPSVTQKYVIIRRMPDIHTNARDVRPGCAREEDLARSFRREKSEIQKLSAAENFSKSRGTSQRAPQSPRTVDSRGFDPSSRKPRRARNVS